VGEIIKVKWWGYLGQVVGISRPSGGDIKVRGRGLEVKVKKKWWGVRALSNSLYYCTKFFVQLFSIDGVKNEHYVPLVFCLLNDKRTETYEKCFKSLPFTTPLNELGKKGLFLDVDFIYLKRGGEKCKNWVSLKTINLITRLGNS
jgi:hypothetical protein